MSKVYLYQVKDRVHFFNTKGRILPVPEWLSAPKEIDFVTLPTQLVKKAKEQIVADS